MKRVDKLIAQVRRQTENNDVSSTTGIQDIEFLQYLNDAQNRLQGLILQQHPSVFQVEKIINLTSNQEVYDIPANAFLFNKITQIDYSPTGRDEDYYPLQLASLKNRTPGVTGHPLFYIRKSGKILLSPIPQTSVAKMRVTYVKKIDLLDLRRGVISAAATTGNSITSLFLDTTTTPVIDGDTLNAEDYICVVDRDGNILMRNISIDSVNTATGEVTVTSGFTFDDGETIPVGAFVVAGKDTTTHSELPRNAERYLLSYCAWKIFARDSSIDIQEQSQELLLLERDIVDSFADIEDDVQYVPILTDWVREGYE